MDELVRDGTLKMQEFSKAKIYYANQACALAFVDLFVCCSAYSTACVAHLFVCLFLSRCSVCKCLRSWSLLCRRPAKLSRKPANRSMRMFSSRQSQGSVKSLPPGFPFAHRGCVCFKLLSSSLERCFFLLLLRNPVDPSKHACQLLGPPNTSVACYVATRVECNQPDGTLH